MEELRKNQSIYTQVFKEKDKEQKACSKKKEEEEISEIVLRGVSLSRSEQSYKKNQVMPLSKAILEQETEKEEQVSSYCKSFAGLMKKINMSIYFRIILFNLLLLFLISCLMQGIKSKPEIVKIGETIQAYGQIGFGMVFILELINWKKHSKLWLILDFICLTTGAAAFLMESDQAFRYLKAIRCLKLLFFIKIFSSLNLAARIFIYAWFRVTKLLIPLLLIVFVTTIGNYTAFVDLQYNKCRDPINKNLTSNWTVYSAEIFICGDRPCPVVDGIQYECLNPLDYNVVPNPEELNNFAQGYGLLGFTNVGTSLFTISKQLFVTGSTKIIGLYKTSFQSELIVLCSISFVFIFSIMYFNIVFGLLIIEKLQKEKREENEIKSSNSSMNSSEFSSKLSQKTNRDQSQFRDKQKIAFTVQPRNVENPSIICESIAKSSQAKSQKKYPNIFQVVQEISIHSQSMPKSQHSVEQQQKQWFETCKNVRVLISFLCCINLCFDFEGLSMELRYIRSWIELCFYIIFLIEMIMLIIYEKCIRKIETGIHLKFQLSVGFLYTVGLVYDGVVSSSVEDFILGNRVFSKICRSFIFLRIFSTLASSPYCLNQSDHILLKVPQSIYMIRHFLLVWFLGGIIFSIMGFHLHNKKELALTGEWYDRFDFEGIYPSAIFTLLTMFDEEWDTLMLKQYAYSNLLIIFWQFIVVTFGHIMFVKYLIISIASALEEILSEKKKKIIQANIKLESEKKLKEQSLQIEVSINAVSNTIEEDNQQNNEQDNCFHSCKVYWRKIKDIALKVIQSVVYQIIKVIITLIVCFTLLITHPQADPQSDTYQLAKKISMFCTCFYFSQFLARVFCEGFWNKKRAISQRVYFLIQIAILLMELLIFTPASSLDIYYSIERIRILRITYIIKIRSEMDRNMKILIVSIFRLYRENIRTAVFFFLTFFFFGIILVKIYQNDHYYCDNAFQFASIQTKEDCLNWGGDWVKQTLSMEQPLSGAKYAFIISTVGGWATIMGSAMDMNGEGMAPSMNANSHIQIFFVVIFFLGHIILYNSFISITLYKYKCIKEEETGEQQLNENQRIWLRIKLQISKLSPIEKETQPKNIVRKYIYRFYHHKSYLVVRGVMFFCTFLYLCISGVGESLNRENIYVWAFMAIIVLFDVVTIFTALGLKVGRKVNILYFGLLLQSIPSFFIVMFIENDQVKSYGSVVLICILIFNFIEFLNRIPSLQKLFNPILKVLPQTGNFFILIVALLLIFMILGMHLFSFLKFGKQLNQYNQNYTNPSYAFYSILKISLSESSIEQIVDTSRQFAPNFLCNQINNYGQFVTYGQTGCGSKWYANLFYLTFHFLYNIFLMSIFLGFTVEIYADVLREENSHVTKYLLKKTQGLWSQKDPQATGLISYQQFWLLARKIISLYEGRGNKTAPQNKNYYLNEEKETLLKKLDLTVYEDQNGKLCFQFSEFIQQITKSYMQKKMNCIFEESKVKLIAEQWIEKKEKTNLKKTSFKSCDVYILILLKSGLKAWKNKVSKQNLIFNIGEILGEKFKESRMPFLKI